MSEARLIELAPIVERVGDPTFVLIGPDDPEGMLRHTRECRQRGYPFIADPSQQLAFGEGELIRELIDGAAFLFSNEYESHLIESKTGWSADEILDRVGTQVIHAGQGRRADRRRSGEATIEVRRRRRDRRRADRRRRRVPGRASWPRSSGGSATSAPPRSAACSRRTSWRRSARRSTPSPRAEFVARLETSTAARRPPTSAAPAPECRSADPPHEVARHAVVGGLLAERTPVRASGTTPGRRPRAAASSAATATMSPTATSPIRSASSMTGSGQSMPAAVELERRRSRRRPRRAAAARPRGARPGRPRPPRPRSCRGSSETRTLPWVSAPIAASTWLGSSVLAVQAEPLATANPRRSSSVDQRLAVDVEAGEGDQVGEPVDSGSPTTSVSGIAATAARIRSTSACWRALVTSSRSATTACSAAAAASAAGTFSKPVDALVDAVVARGTGCATGRPCAPAARRRRPGRPTCAPTPAAADQPSGSGSRPGRRTGVGEQWRGRDRRGHLGHRLEGADLVVGRLDGEHAGPAVHPGPPRPPREGRPGPSRPPARWPWAPATRPAACEHRRVLDGRVHDRAALTSAAPGEQAEQAEVHRVRAARRERHLVGAHAQALRHHGPRVVEQSRACRAGPCSRRGSAYPCSSAASNAARAAGCNGSDEALSKYAGAGSTRRNVLGTCRGPAPVVTPAQ